MLRARWSLRCPIRPRFSGPGSRCRGPALHARPWLLWPKRPSRHRSPNRSVRRRVLPCRCYAPVLVWCSLSWPQGRRSRVAILPTCCSRTCCALPACPMRRRFWASRSAGRFCSAASWTRGRMRPAISYRASSWRSWSRHRARAYGWSGCRQFVLPGVPMPRITTASWKWKGLGWPGPCRVLSC